MHNQNKFLVILTVFLSTLAVLNILSVKIVSIGPLSVTIGAYLYSITFPCTDVISEVWGKEKAHLTVKLGLLCYTLVLVLILFSVYHPPAVFWQEKDNAFKSIIGLAPRIQLGSICSYVFAQSYDVWAFHFVKKITNGRYLWLRNNLSTITSQFFDTIIFGVIAFAGVISNDELIQVILGTYIIKLLVAFIDTPVVYLLVKWARK